MMGMTRDVGSRGGGRRSISSNITTRVEETGYTLLSGVASCRENKESTQSLVFVRWRRKK